MLVFAGNNISRIAEAKPLLSRDDRFKPDRTRREIPRIKKEYCDFHLLKGSV